MTFRCGRPAVWSPRALSAALVVATAVAGFREGALSDHVMATGFRMMIVAAGFAAAVWVTWSGSEVRLRVRLDDRGIELFGRGRSRRVPFDTIDEIDFAPPFGDRGAWLPALVLLTADAGRYRIPALLREGARLVEEIVRRSGRSDLEAWVSARKLSRRMTRGANLVPIVYAIAAAIVTASLLLRLRS